MHRDWWNGSRLGLFSFKADLARTLLIAAIVAGWLAVIVPTGGAPSSTGNKHPDKLTEGAMRLLYANCLSCHNAEKHKGGLELTSRAAALKGGEDGPVIVPGHPDKSILLKALAPDADPHMPPKKQLSSDQIQLLRRWIGAGAPWNQTAL